MGGAGGVILEVRLIDAVMIGSRAESRWGMVGAGMVGIDRDSGDVDAWIVEVG